LEKNSTYSFNTQEHWTISDAPFGAKFKSGVAESPLESEFVKWKNVVRVGFSVLARPVNASRPQLEHCK